MTRLKTAISMPDGLAEKTDRMAAQLGISRSEVIQRALERFVEDESDEAITRSLNQVYDTTSSHLDPAFAGHQTALLIDEGW